METEKRIFKVSDVNMMEQSKTMHSHFVDDQVAFTDFDNDFAPPYEGDWQSAINVSGSQLTDEIIRDQMEEDTADVVAGMKLCRDKFQDSKHFIEKAFPNNKAVQKEFGYDNYDRDRKGQGTFISFMKLFFETATKYSGELAAKGYDAAKVAEIETLTINLEKKERHQEKFKGDRGVITQTRIETHNALWAITVNVSRVGKRVFKDNAARYNLYLLPASDENPAELSITGTITDSVSGNPIEDAEVAIASDSIAVFTDSNGQFAIASLTDGSYDLKVSANGYTTQTINGVVVDNSDTQPTITNVQLVATV